MLGTVLGTRAEPCGGNARRTLRLDDRRRHHGDHDSAGPPAAAAPAPDPGRATLTPDAAERRRARFEQVAGELVEPLRRYLARRTDGATADDVLADTLLVCWRRFDELPAQPLPWAYAVARGCLANAERAARRQRRVAGKVAALDPPRQVDVAPEGDADLAQALQSLRVEDAELLRLWAWEQLTPAELARVLDVTPNAAGLRLGRARRRLAEELRRIERRAGHEESTEERRP